MNHRSLGVQVIHAIRLHLKLFLFAFQLINDGVWYFGCRMSLPTFGLIQEHLSYNGNVSSYHEVKSILFTVKEADFSADDSCFALKFLCLFKREYDL